MASGSWEKSARNIVYENDELHCYLQDFKGNWEQNKLRFVPGLDYSNINGKFEWSNCQNNVEIDKYDHENIKRRYTEISIQECLKHSDRNYMDWFVIESKIMKSIKNNCISISLFRKNVDTTFENQYPVDENKWNTKYYKKLIRNLDNFTNFRDFCVNLYLANDLKHLIGKFSKYRFLNIFLMKSSSIGAQPGTLWRFLDMTNKSYDSVYICDIDESWDWVNYWFHNINLDRYILCTITPEDNIISKNPYSPCRNFATIIGSHIKINPSAFHFNLIDVMVGFIVLCKKREKSRNPYCFKDNDQVTCWNHPIGDKLHGWGRCITAYGFDELFLKHVIYYYVYPSIKFL